MDRDSLTARTIAIARSVELQMLAISTGIIVGVWGFAELADEVIEGETQGIDRQLLLLLRTPGDLADPLGPPVAEEIGRDLTALGGIIALTLATLATCGFFLLLRRYGSAFYMGATVGGGILLSSVAKGLFDRARPDLVPHGSIVHTASFPSGHSTMAAITYLTLAVLIARVLPQRRLKVYVMTVAVLLTVLVGVSRVYLGVHWPTDVLSGWLVGLAWAMLCLLGARLLARHGRVEPDADEGDPETGAPGQGP
ncbi:phosphatase PAP2 family protein [Salipiger mucosus]|uniref:PA-phosphatase related protein phosphoesterase n=1 Tax=Salipiger mucosus DSM 16094 TaxID=1123237 RepID=S9QAJ2_9RHOB|nr:phosphatase PAP2 family protein [Salipiger mucosus]EPX78396.1 PA-phosphatase related protein phosphoesterase [Salipiger mucosus DSM 16094]